MSRPIEDYALIGDGRSAALVSRDGSMDWLCWPRFDSDACFAALLGTADNGRWHIGPADPRAGSTRRYRPDTLVVDTEFCTATGTARLTDFMAAQPQGGAPAVVRLAEGLHGSVEFTFDIRARLDNGQIKPWIRADGAGAIVGVVGPDLLVLRADLELDSSQDGVHRRFTLRAGERAWFTLQHGDSAGDAPAPLDPDAALRETEAYWRDWIGRFTTPTHWPEAVRRSLLTLKALIHRPTGGLVAAPTLGLPETPGGQMNWDYRYCWLRDSTFTLVTLLNAGYHEEARAWLHWLMRAIAGMPDKMQIMYRVDGDRHIEERQAAWLPGWNGARPVRVGNQAAQQFQLDVYGEVLASTYLAGKAGIERTSWGIEVEARLIAHLETVWRRPDQGLWESRGRPRHYVYSKVMCWVAFDRFLRGEHTRAALDAAGVRRLETVRDAVHADICRHGFNRRRNSFTRSYGSRRLDASLLLLPLVGFLPADDPRMAGTVAAIERELTDGGLVRRTRKPLLGRGEGAFIACTCWLADCMLLQGRTADATAALERVLALRNDVGLLSEEFDVRGGRQLGNFPQALSHLALVNTALALSGTPPWGRDGT